MFLFESFESFVLSSSQELRSACFNLSCDQVTTKTETGVEFSSGGSSNIKSGKVSGYLETKYQVKDLGMTLTEKWTTDNNLSTTVAVVNKLIPGAKISLDTNFAPGTGVRLGTVTVLTIKDFFL